VTITGEPAAIPLVIACASPNFHPAGARVGFANLEEALDRILDEGKERSVAAVRHKYGASRSASAQQLQHLSEQFGSSSKSRLRMLLFENTELLPKSQVF
jgi:hypothetical protein